MPENFKVRKGQNPVRLASTTGHVVIVGSEWQEVPEVLVPEALKHGLLSKELYDAALAEVRGSMTETLMSSDVDPILTAPVVPVPPVDLVPPVPAAPDAEELARQAAIERNNNILLAIKKVLDLKESGAEATPNGKGLISATNGMPKVDAVSEFAGFKVSAVEIEEALK